MKKLTNTIKLIVLLFISTLSFFATCRKENANCHSKFVIRNNSSVHIYYKFSPDSSLINLLNSPIVDPPTFKIEPGAKRTGVIHGACLEDYIISSTTGKLYFFFFEPSVIENYSWDFVKQNYLLLNRYGFTKAQLDSMNWTITYQ